MKILEILVSAGLILICITWSGLKVSEFYYKTHPPQEITQPGEDETKQVEPKVVKRKVDGVADWVLELEALSVTNPEKFRHANNGNLWAYNKVGIWIWGGADYVEIWGRGDIQLTDLEKSILFNAYTEWNKGRAETAKSNFKID